MKYIASVLIIFITVSTAFCQSESFITLKNKFHGSDNVHSFATSGFLAKAVLWMAGERDFRDAVKNIKQIRLISIPKREFEANDVTLNGFKKILRKDSFEELATVRDHGDDVTLYLQTNKQVKNNRYFLIVDDESEVIAIEIKGYIDPDVMLKNSQYSSNKL